MTVQRNIEAIREVYAAFARGDLKVVLDALADDVDWATDTTSTDAPWYGGRKGKQEVSDFFEQFGSAMEVEDFTLKAIAGNDTDVFALVHCRAKARATNVVSDMDLHHYFVFDDDKVVFYRGTEDTVQVAAALRS